MLGLRRYKKVQIDIWQGNIESFAVDGVVQIVDQTNVGATCHPAPVEAAASFAIATSAKNYLSLDPADELRSSSPYADIYDCAEASGLRHIALVKYPAHFFNSKTFDQFTEHAMMVFKECIVNAPPRSLSRITFVANSSATYNSLQEQLFARFPDELDEEGY